MLYPVPFEAEHVFKMDMQDAQKWVKDHLDVKNIRYLENQWTATLMEDGIPILCGGPLAFWHNRALVWSFVSNRINRGNFLHIHNRVRKYLDGLPFNRLEAAVDVDFEAGHRWALSLGFKVEAPCMKSYQMNGKDCTLYAKVRS